MLLSNFVGHNLNKNKIFSFHEHRRVEAEFSAIFTSSTMTSSPSMLLGVLSSILPPSESSISTFVKSPIATTFASVRKSSVFAAQPGESRRSAQPSIESVFNWFVCFIFPDFHSKMLQPDSAAVLKAQEPVHSVTFMSQQLQAGKRNGNIAVFCLSVSRPRVFFLYVFIHFFACYLLNGSLALF